MNQQLKAFLLSYGRVFLGACIAAYFMVNKSPLELDFHDGKVILAAGISALIISVGNALNPKDERYGIGAPGSKDLSAGDVATNAPKDPGYGVIELVVGVLLVLILAVVLLRLA